MPAPSDFQSRRGTVAVTFTQTGTYSTWADMGGMDLIGIAAPGWPSAAGSLTFRASLDGQGTGVLLTNENGVPYRIASMGSGTYAQLSAGSVITAAPHLLVQVGTAGTAGVAAGGTLYLIGRA